MKELSRKYIIKNYRYFVAICVVYYLCPVLMLLGNDVIVLMSLSIKYIPVVVLITSIIFATKNNFHLYFSCITAILWIPVLIIKFDFIIIMIILFIISLTGQLLGIIIYKFLNR